MWTLTIGEYDDRQILLSKKFNNEQDAKDFLDVFYVVTQEMLATGYDFYWNIFEDNNSDKDNAIEQIIDVLIKKYAKEFIQEQVGTNFDSDYASSESINEIKNGDFQQGLVKVAYEIVNKIPDLKYMLDEDKFLTEIPSYIKEHM